MEYKSKLYGSKLVVADRFYPSSKTCSNCGEKKHSLLLSERVFCCEKCHYQIDRDLNAAKNLEKLGQAMAEVTPVDRKEPTPLDEAGSKIDSNRVIISLKT
ncbi:Transposase, IS605 OrfB [Crocosphaera watsonii WH 0402]|uniref:Transposase, IS605 OrfB n=1 Tax=Crocosphaera watsonii WH 0402 TaxID=1284629 RepID=T2JZL3_CROWT|nr:Transposase, IS605 OrfB [Crocosphaera watsonii WH 0402]